MQPEANDLTPLGKVRIQFCERTGFDSPFDVIKAGIKNDGDWLEALDKYRLENPSYCKAAVTTTTEPLKTEVQLRQQILEYMSTHCIKNKWGLSAKEICEGISKAENTVRDLLNDMTEEGLVTVVKVLRAKKSRSVMYRIAGIDEVSHEK